MDDRCQIIADILEYLEHAPEGMRRLRAFLARDDAEAQRRQTILREQTNPKEKEVLRWVADGRTSAWIAIRMAISCRTVEAHRRNLLRKLDEPNTAGLVQWAAYLPCSV